MTFVSSVKVLWPFGCIFPCDDADLDLTKKLSGHGDISGMVRLFCLLEGGRTQFSTFRLKYGISQDSRTTRSPPLPALPDDNFAEIVMTSNFFINRH